MDEAMRELIFKVKVDIGYLRRSIKQLASHQDYARLAAEMEQVLETWVWRVGRQAKDEPSCPVCSTREICGALDKNALAELRGENVLNHPDGQTTDVVPKDDIC